MSADRQHDEVRKDADALERRGDQMEHQLDELGQDIDEAKKVAAQRQDAPDDTEPPAETENVAGDWQGESSGADHGEDAEDTQDGPQAGADGSGDAEKAD